jgi:tripartite-type tricarboxylate transporter receptor subunit TctC
MTRQLPTLPRRSLLKIAAAAVAAPNISWAASDIANGRPITLVCSYPPGGGADLMARLVSAPLAKTLGQSVVVENRPGGSGQIAASLVARSQPDGSTLLVDASSFAVNPSLFAKLPYDTDKDFAPLGVIALFPNVLVCTPSFPAKSVKDLIKMAKASPGRISFASSGNGSAQHLAGALFEDRASVQLVHVPYRGGGPAMNDVMAGQVPLFFANVASSLGLIQTGKLRPLAVTSRHRARALPNVPTMEEAGVPSYEVFEWNPVLAPAHVAPATLQRLRQSLQTAIGDPEVLGRIRSLSGEMLEDNSPAGVEKFLRTQEAQWARVVREHKIVVG